MIATMEGCRALTRALESESVSVIFGLPGGAIMPVYDALLDSGMRHILVRHEQSAAHMADGYARASGKTGVCMATSGPGAANLVTGIANAYMDSSPMVAITGQVPRSLIGRDSFQEIDIVGITTPISKYNFQVRHASEIPAVVKTAFYVASNGRPGPVLIDIPKDVQTETSDVNFNSQLLVRTWRNNGDPDPILVKRAAEALAMAERPFILAGGGVRISNAYEELRVLSELLSAPVGTSLMGKGCFPEDHPLSLGMVGMHGSAEANRLVQQADVLLAVGMRFSDRTTSRPDDFCRDARIIHLDIDPSEIEKNKEVNIFIVGDARKTLRGIYELLAGQLARNGHSSLERIEEVKELLRQQIASNGGKGLSPYQVLSEARKVLPRDAIVTTEVGQNQMWTAAYWKTYAPRTFITSGGLGTMGFGFPAAIGAKVAKPEAVVVDIAGDGSFLMTENCLATSISESIPVIVIVLNNGMLGMVAQWQRMFYKGRYSATRLGRSPDFVKLARAYGADAERVESLDQLSNVLRRAASSDVTTVIDVPIHPEENVLPMVPPGKSIDEMILT